VPIPFGITTMGESGLLARGINPLDLFTTSGTLYRDFSSLCLFRTGTYQLRWINYQPVARETPRPQTGEPRFGARYLPPERETSGAYGRCPCGSFSRRQAADGRSTRKTNRSSHTRYEAPSLTSQIEK
jgi:hypothetical protein